METTVRSMNSTNLNPCLLKICLKSVPKVLRASLAPCVHPGTAAQPTYEAKDTNMAEVSWIAGKSIRF